MQSKLTIHLDAELLRQVCAYARRLHKSVSVVVAEHLASLGADRSNGRESLPPKVRSLSGVLRGRRVSEKDYSAHLEEKHR
jgi:hypothetical protein